MDDIVTTRQQIEIDSHSINFGPQHPAAHGVRRLVHVDIEQRMGRAAGRGGDIGRGVRRGAFRRRSLGPGGAREADGHRGQRGGGEEIATRNRAAVGATGIADVHGEVGWGAGVLAISAVILRAAKDPADCPVDSSLRSE